MFIVNFINDSVRENLNSRFWRYNELLMIADEKFMARCNELALESHEKGDLPFGALVVFEGNILAEALNTGLQDLTGHAEINALKKSVKKLPDIDFSKCSLYTNFEPCAMCSYVIRDQGIARVVYSVVSPHLGGQSKWNILSDHIRPEFVSGKHSQSPEIISGVLRDECSRIFDELGWRMHRPD